jgi:hypothetical protein
MTAYAKHREMGILILVPVLYKDGKQSKTDALYLEGYHYFASY